VSWQRAVLLAAVAALLAGCIGATNDADVDQASVDEQPDDPLGPVNASQLSVPEHELDRVVETFLPSHDDTELHTAEYHPDVGEDEQTPVVIQLSPYFGNLDAEPQAQQDSYWTEVLVQRGYTVVHASVRGTGYSGGCFQLGGPDEVQDARELVEHYHEADWSNGNVSLIGISYPGTTPWQAAITDAPGLQTIVPMQGITDMYRYDHVNGASYTHGPFFPTYYTALVDWALVPENADQPAHLLGPIEAACPGAAERIAEGYETLATGTHDTFWDERNYEARVDDVDVPVFLVHGFQDWNVDPDNGVPLFDELPGESKTWIGQWEHNIPFDNTHNEDWSRHDWNATMVAWFDKWLKGIDNGITEQQPVLVQDDIGHWYRTETWPPEDRQPTELFLSGEGELVDDPPEAATVEMAKDPSNAAGEAPTDAEAVRGDESVRFTSEPLPEDTLIPGRPTVQLEVAVDQPDGHLVADLYDEDGEEGPRWLGHAILNLAHRESRDERTPMPQGSFEPVELEFMPVNAFVPEGHRLGLELSPEKPGWIHPSPHSPSYELRLGGEDPARLSFWDLDDPGFEEAPDRGEVRWSE
jgi:X-Pro dipeptidyl-peptidase